MEFADPYQAEYDASDGVHSVDWSDEEKTELYEVEMEEPLNSSPLRDFIQLI